MIMRTLFILSEAAVKLAQLVLNTRNFARDYANIAMW